LLFSDLSLQDRSLVSASQGRRYAYSEMVLVRPHAPTVGLNDTPRVNREEIAILDSGGLPGWGQRFITARHRVRSPAGPHCAQSSSTAGRRKPYFRRFAARRAASRTQVTGFAPSASAACSMARFSSRVMGNFMDSVRLSFGAFLGLAMS